jgi:hypothetical protein
MASALPSSHSAAHPRERGRARDGDHPGIRSTPMT